MCENRLEFPEGKEGGAKLKPSMGGVWIFSGSAQYHVMVWLFLRQCVCVCVCVCFQSYCLMSFGDHNNFSNTKKTALFLGLKCYVL